MATEKRLIDVNAADVERISCYYGDHCYIEDVQEWLHEQPTVDAVEVVRCKDCQHCDVYQKEAYSGTMLICMIHSFQVVDPIDFCSYGERKGNE